MRAGRAVSAVDFQALADLRYRIRRFLRLRETAARSAGIEPQQYLVLLQIKGLEGRGPATISALAERLQVRHHAVVPLITRLTRRAAIGARWWWRCCRRARASCSGWPATRSASSRRKGRC